MKKRILSFLLALLMVVSIFPAPAYATDSTDVTITPTETPTEEATEIATETACPTCGTVGCTSEHLTWCPECKVDDCGKTHVFCEICQKNDCGQNHCPTCGTAGCTSEHLNWCDLCKIDNCGKNHCPVCRAVDCTVDHDAPAPTAAPTEPVQPASDEEAPDYSGDIGRYVKLNTAVQNFTVYGLTPSTGTLDTQTFIHEDFQTGTILRIADWMMMDETVWYQVTFYKGGTQGSYVGDFPAEPWFKQTEAGELVFLSTCGICSRPDCAGHTWCETCEKYDCGIDHSQPENPCDCGCETCTGAEDCECLCGNCEFCEKPEEPTVPSISTIVNGQTVTVNGTLPQGVDMNLSASRKESGVTNTIEYDIELALNGESYEPESAVSVTISGIDVVPGGFVKVIHFLEDLEAIKHGYGNGTVQIWTDSSIASAYPAAAAAAQEALGMADTVCVEQFYSTENEVSVGNGTISFAATSFSIYTVTYTGTDAGRAYAVYDDDNGTAQNSNGYSETHEITMDDSNGQTFMLTRGQKFYLDIGPTFFKIGMTSYQWYLSESSIGSMDTSGFGTLAGNDTVLTVSTNAPLYKHYTITLVGYNIRGNEKDRRYINVYVVPEVQLIFYPNIPSGATSSNLTVPSSRKTVLGDGSTAVKYTRVQVLNPSGTVTGYTFVGWYTAATGGEKVSSGSYVFLDNDNAELVSGGYSDQYQEKLYAQWKANDYTVKFNANGGSNSVTGSMPTLNMTYDVETTLPRNQFINQGDGMVFLGWATSPTGDVVYKDGAKIKNLTATNNDTVTLYAKWKYGLASTVYIGINNTYHNPKGTYTAGGVTINSYHTYPNEPAQMTGDFDRVTDTSGGWTYNSESAVPLKNQAASYISGNIFKSPDYEMTYVEGENTLGIADPTGDAVRAMLKFSEADYQAMITAWLNGMRSTLTGYGDTSVDWQNAKPEDFVMVPYVIKFQNYDSWYIDMVVKPKALYTLAYDGNIENGYTASFTGVAFPPSAQHTEGTNVSVVSTPIGYQNNNLKVTKVIDGHTYTAEFQYWYDAKGNTYGGSTGRNTITLTEDTILYAKWNYPDASFGNLNITKTVVDRDAYEDPSATQSFTFKFTTNAAGNYNYTIYDRAANVKATGTIANNGTFTLQDGWRIRITDLPKGATYTVTETAVNYYTASGTVSGTISAGATTYATVTNTFQKNAGYTVKHYLQNNDKTGYIEQAADQQNLYGIIGQSTSALAKTYSGYTVNTFSQAAISADGSTVISIYYDLVSTATVIWKNWDGTVLETDENVAYGTKPSYDGEDPEKAATAQYTYTFDGWVEEIVAVTGDATYTAKFKETVNKYKVTFVDEDGTILLVETEYDYGTKAADIAKPTDPTKEGNDEFTYTFAGWIPEITDVTENVVYTATYTQATNMHDVTGTINNGGTVTNTPQSVAHGKENQPMVFTPAQGYEISSVTVNGETVATFYPDSYSFCQTITKDTTVEVTTSCVEYTISYELNGGLLADGVTNPATYTVVTETFTLNNPTRAGYKFKGWATSENATTGTESITIEKGSTGNKTYYAVWERSLVDLTITTTSADQEQSYIFTVSGTPSNSSYGTITLDVVLVGTDSITIKDLPVGEYTVTEKDGWSWRENSVESKTADLRTTSQIVSFDFGIVDDLHWLSGYSYKRKKGGS